MKNRDKIVGLPAGSTCLEQKSCKLQKGQIVVIHSGMERINFAMSIVQYVGIMEKICLMFLSEISTYQMISHMLCSQANIEIERAQIGRLNSEDFEHLAESIKRMENIQIYIDKSGMKTPTKIFSKAQKLQKSIGLDLLVIDYQQLMNLDARNENRQIEIARINRSLKKIAKKLGVPAVILL